MRAETEQGMATQFTLFPISTPTSQHYPDPLIPKRSDHATTPATQQVKKSHVNITLPQYVQKLNNSGTLPYSIVVLIAYTTWLVSEVSDLSWEDVLKKAGVQRIIGTFLDVRAKKLNRVHDEESGTMIPEVTETSRGDKMGRVSESETPILTPPEQEEYRPITISKTHRVKRELKTCLRLRDLSKTIPLRAPGCKGSRRSDGDETPRSVSWGWDSESDTGSACGSECSTPLEEVFFVEKCELESMGVEMLVVRDERVVEEDEDGDEMENEKERRGSLLAMKIERKLSL